MNNYSGKSKLLSWFIGRPRTSGFIAFLFLFVVVIFIVYQRYSLIKENDRREMSNLLDVAYSNLDQSLKNASNSALTLALSLNDDGESVNFSTVAEKIMASNTQIDAVQLVPGGIISEVYPFEANDEAIGLNILKDPYVRRQAFESINRRKMYFAGPLNLTQGGVGIVGRLPIFKEDKFWGFSAVVIKLETFLRNSGIKTIDDSKYYFQLSMTDPAGNETFFLPVKEDFSAKYFESVPFTDANWKLYIITKDQYAVYRSLLPLSIVGTILAVLFGLIIQLLLRKPAQLNKLVIKQAEKLVANEVKYKSMFTHAAIGIANINALTGELVEVNDPFCQLLGYTREEMMPKKFADITHPDDLAENKRLVEELKQGNIANFSLEKRYFKKSGDIIWANVTISALWENGEIPTNVIAIVEDITLKKQAEEKIARSEARFKSLFDDSPIALWEEDFSQVKTYINSLPIVANGAAVSDYFRSNPDILKKCISLIKIIDVNNECLKLHYPKTKAQLSESVESMLDDHSLEVFITQMTAITNGETQLSMESRVRLISGEMRDIALRWSVMPTYENTFERVIVSTEDITDEKNSQRIILNSRQRLENLINTIDGIVWECDAVTFEMHFISTQTYPILGYTVEEWSADPDFWQNHMHPDDHDQAFATFLDIAKHLVEKDFEYRMIAKDGSIVWIRDMVSSLYEDERTILRGIMIDITANKAAEQDLKKSFQLVTEQKKRLMNFSFIVSHNLRSHAANIQSITGFIASAETADESDEMIGMLQTVSGSLNETLLNLNDVINVQANVSLVSESLSLKEFVANTLTILSKEITSKQAIIYNNVPEVIVQYHPAYLESILLNLISNALKYCRPNVPPVITIDWIQENGNKILKIADEGIGIDLQKNGDKIFGLYKTFNGNTDARGIGLFMTRTQIEAMGGKISVASELGKGTVFTVFFK